MKFTTGLFNLHDLFASFWANILMDMSFAINSAFISFFSFFDWTGSGAQSITDNESASFVDKLRALTEAVSSQFQGMTTITNIFKWVGLAFILYKFGLYVTHEYIIKQDNRPPAPITHTIKKTAISIILIVFLPYVVFTPYFASTELGLAISSNIMEGSGDSKGITDYIDYQIYTDMNDIGAKWSTYCRFDENTEVPNVATSGDMNVISDPSVLGDTSSPEYKNLASHVGKDKDGNPVEGKDIDSLKAAYTRVYNNTCNESAGYQIRDGFMAHAPYANTLILGNPNMPNGFIGFFIFLAISGFQACAAYILVRRMLDAIMLNVMGWYFIGNSISDPNAKPIMDFFKRLASICLTQFVVLIEISLFTLTQYANMFSPIATNQGAVGSFMLRSFLIPVTWIMFLLSTPTVIEGMVHDTGAKSAGFAGVKNMVKTTSKAAK